VPETPHRDGVHTGAAPSVSWRGDFAELGLPDVQNSVDEVDIGAIEAKPFAGPQARTRQQVDRHRRHSPVEVSLAKAAACRNE
jgi:hypothetical protein